MRRTTSKFVWTVITFWSFLLLPVCHASSTSNGETTSTVMPPPPSMSVSSSLPSSSNRATCPSRTANYITHNLPQQCLKINWTRSINGTASAAGEFKEASTDSVTTIGSNATIDVRNTEAPSPETGAEEDAISATSVVSIQDVTEPEPIPSSSSEPISSSSSEPISSSSSEPIPSSFSEPILSSSSEPIPSTSSEPIPSTSSEPASTDTESESDSPLDNAKFLSFEEWKKQNLAKIGQSPENVGQGRAATVDRRKRPSPIALDSLGEDSEIDIDFGFGPGKHEDPPSTWPSQAAEVANGGPSLSDESGTSDSRGKKKDAGTTCKERFNYASFDCAATILKTNPRCKSSASILVENKDSYMLNECAAENKFIVVELCDDIWIDTIVLANFEFFSSMFRTFRVSISDRYPIKMDRWKELGVFEAMNSREIQAFAIENPLIWARYLKVEFLTHYGNEYYCPVSLLRVHGTTMMEEFKSQYEEVRGDDEIGDGLEEVASPASGEKPEPSITQPVESSKEPLAEEAEVMFNMASNLSAIASPNSQSGSAHAQNVSSSTADAMPSSTGLNTGKDKSLEGDIISTTPTSLVEPEMTAHSTEHENTSHIGNATTADGFEAVAVIETTVTNFTTSENITASKPSQASQDASRTPSAPAQPPAASPTTQENFFKSVHKRLQMIEANSTLSLQYIEEQSRILRDAFAKVEKRQMSKAETFLQYLNDTVIAELKGFRQQYDQLWQSTVIELETNREQYQHEMSALSTRLTLMADELVFQKRMAVVQSTLLLFCLGLVLFVRSGSSSLELPLMQQVLTKSHSMIRQPSEYSPPGSPSSRDTSPRFKARRKFGRGVGNDADAGSMSPPSRSAEDRRVRTLGMVTPSDADEELMRDPDQLAANGLDDAQSVAGPRFSGSRMPRRLAVRTVMVREARDLAGVNSSSGSKLWRRQEALEASKSCGSGSELWRRQRALGTAASSGDGSKLWGRQCTAIFSGVAVR